MINIGQCAAVNEESRRREPKTYPLKPDSTDGIFPRFIYQVETKMGCNWHRSALHI